MEYTNQSYNQFNMAKIDMFKIEGTGATAPNDKTVNVGTLRRLSII